VPRNTKVEYDAASNGERKKHTHKMNE